MFVFISFQFIDAQYVWKQKADFPGEARSGAVSFVIGNYAYVGLGYNGSTVKRDFWRYNPNDNSWTQIADFGGVARQYAVAFVINDTAYVGTGDNGYPTYEKFKDFWKFNADSNTWTKISDFGGTARTSAACFTIDGKGYVTTGIDAVDEQKDLWEYDPVSDIWTKKADVDGDKRKDAVGFAINGKGYLCSGWYFDSFSMVLSDVQEYNPETNSWSEKIFADGSLTKKQNAGCFIMDNKAYLISGNNNNSVVIYNPVNNELTTEEGTFGPSGETKRNGVIAFSIENQGYAGLGYIMESISNLIYKNDIWTFAEPTIPVAPSNFEVTCSPGNYFYCKWKDNSDDETSFVIEYSVGTNSNYKLGIEVQSNRTNANYGYSATIDTSVHFFRIRAKNSVGYSEASNEDTIITYAGNQTGLVAIPYSINQIDLKWNDNSSSEEGFYIERSVNGTDEFVKIDSLPPSDYNTSYSDMNVTEGTVYYYRIGAKYGNVVKYSNIDFASPIEQGSWTLLTRDYYMPRSSIGFHFNNNIYFGLGESTNMWVYDFNKDTIKQKNSFPGNKISSFSSFKIGNKGYACYGWDYDLSRYINELWEYNFDTDTWTKRNAIDDTVRANSRVFSLGNYAYMIGGQRIVFTLENEVQFKGENNQVLEYNSSENTWTRLKGFPGNNVTGVPAFSYNGRGYLLHNQCELWEFSQVTKEWTKIKTFSQKISCDNGMAVDSSFYFFGGDYFHKGIFFEYDIEKDTLIKRTLFYENVYSNYPILSDEKLLIGVSHSGNEIWDYNVMVPQAPGNLTAVASDYNTIELNWKDNSKVELKFYIERASYDDHHFILIDSVNANTTYYNDSTVEMEKKYYYRIRAKNTFGYSNYSNEAFSLTDVPITPEFYMVIPEFNSGNVMIQWMNYSGKTDGALGFILERSEEVQPANFTVLDSIVDEHNYTDKNLTIGKLYYYRLRSYNKLGNSEYSTVAKVIPGSLTMQDGKFLVSESISFDQWGYNIPYYRCFSYTQTISPLNEGEKTTINFKEFDIYDEDTLKIYDGEDINSPLIGAYTSTNIPNSLVYSTNTSGSLTLAFTSTCTGYYKIHEGWMAKIKAYSVIPPSNLRPDGTNTDGLQLVWKDNSENEEYFIIERSVNDSLHFEILDSTLVSNTIMYFDSSYNSNYIYFYRVRTKGAYGYSDFCEMIRVDKPTSGFKEDLQQEFILIYPNPVKDVVFIRFNSSMTDNLNISLIDASGRVVKQTIQEITPGETNITLYMNDNPAGVYFLRIKDSKHIFRKTILKL